MVQTRSRHHSNRFENCYLMYHSREEAIDETNI